MIIKGSPFLLTGTFAATGQSVSVPVFGVFTISVWGTPINGNGTPGAFTGTVQVERSVDGGTTFLPASTDGTGSIAKYSASTVVQGTEYLADAVYRFNCINYTSGAINYSLVGPGWLLE